LKYGEKRAKFSIWRYALCRATQSDFVEISHLARERRQTTRFALKKESI